MATKNRPTAAQIATLVKLEAASRELGGLSRLNLYNDRITHAHMVELQRLGLWFQRSATQGNITDAGCVALASA